MIKGECPHGEFLLNEGCPQCIAERSWIRTASDTPHSVGETAALPKIEFDEPVVISRASPIGTALVNINPAADTLVMACYWEALKAKEYAEERVIATVDDLKPATDDLSLIAKLKKAMEEKRKEYVKPLQDHVKAINEAFKTLMEPIETADQITRGKILAFQLQQKLIREAQEKINALRLEAAQRDAALHNGELSESVNLVEVIPPVATTTRTELGSTGIAKIRKWEVEDLSKVPLDYLMIDAAKVGKVVRAGIPSIPGIRIWLEDSLRVTSKINTR